MKLYLLRHGETEENVKHILQGHMPGTLTEEGKAQARQAAEGLRQLKVEVVLCSDLKRCTDTYEILKAELPELPEVQTTKLLRERGWGSATGMVADGKTRIEIPKDAESMGQLKARARILLDFVRNTYGGKRVLAVTHGLFCRVIQCVLAGNEVKDIEPMKNGEIREIEI